MDTKLHPVVAILVICAVLLAVSIWTWANGSAKSIGGPSELIVDPEGHLYIQMQNQLLEHEADGTFIRRHDLSTLGVDAVIGALAFFPDGDLLLRLGRDDRTFFDKLRAFLRWKNTRSVVPADVATGLHRCNLTTGSCRPFGPEAIDFKAAYGVLIDGNSGHVYIADTTRHVLRKFDTSGRQIAGPAVGFRFPNHLVLQDGSLLVADTNHHRIARVDPSTGTFGRQLGAFDIAPAAANAGGQTWPSHLERVADSWWVNNMTAAMDDGGIYRFDNDWKFAGKVDLPAGADPISLIVFNDEVLVSDWKNDTVHRVSLAGNYLGAFESPGLQDLVRESVERRWRYRVYAWLGAGIFIVVIAVLVLLLFSNRSTAA